MVLFRSARAALQYLRHTPRMVWLQPQDYGGIAGLLGRPVGEGGLVGVCTIVSGSSDEQSWKVQHTKCRFVDDMRNQSFEMIATTVHCHSKCRQL